MSDWVCGRCKSINRDRSATCYSCGGIRGAIQLEPSSAAAAAAPPATPLATPAGAATDAAATFASGIPIAEVAAPAPPAAAEPATMGDLAGGIIGGAIGAILATALWYGVVTVTHWQIGWVAVAVGFVVAQGVVLGAGRHPSILLVPVSLAFTFAALVVSEYFIDVFLINEALTEMQPLLRDPEFAGIEIVYEELQALRSGSPIDIIRTSLESDPLTLLFWAIAGWEAFIIPMRAATRSNAT